MKWIKRKLKDFIYQTILEEVVTWGNCGLCGNSIKNELFWRYWNWGICQDCLVEYEDHEEDIDMAKINCPKDRKNPHIQENLIMMEPTIIHAQNTTTGG